MKRPYVVIFVLILTLALTAALLSACNDKHTHTADVVCTVSEREVLLSYSCSCGATASSLTAEFTGRTGETVTLFPDEEGRINCSTLSGEFGVAVKLDGTVLYETDAVFKPSVYNTAVAGYDYTEGDEIKHITYYSSVAGADKHANVVLPPDYDPEKRYPVLYLLHGLMSDEYSWLDGVYGLPMGAQYIVQNACYFDGTPEMIVVCVNSLVNATETEPEWNMLPPSAPPELAETYDLTGRDIVECLMPYVNSHYSTLTGKDNTAIAGYSMGGREAMLTAFDYQDVFGWVGAFSSASFDENVVSSSTYVPDFTLDEGSDGFRYVQITVGMLDTLAPVSSGICDKLDAIDVEYTYESVFGMHDPSVWRGALKTFVQNIFR